MQQFYGIDLGEPGWMDRRSGRWLAMRLIGLLTVPESRLRRALGVEVPSWHSR